MSTWFSEIPLDAPPLAESRRTPEAVLAADRDLESRATQRVVSSCFIEYVVERLPANTASKNAPPRRTAASPDATAIGGVRVHIESTSPPPPPRPTPPPSPGHSPNSRRRESPSSGEKSPRKQRNDANAAEDEEELRPRAATRHLPAPAARHPSPLATTADAPQPLNSTVATAIPEEHYLRPLPVPSRTVSRPVGPIPAGSARASANAASAPTAAAAAAVPLRKLYEMQVQQLEARDLPGAVVLADIVCSGGAHDRGRFQLLTSMPLFSESAASGDADEAAPPTPTGWRIVYYAPRCAHVRLKLVLLRGDCCLLRDSHVRVAAFRGAAPIPAGGVRVTLPGIAEDYARWRDGSGSAEAVAWWTAVAAGAECRGGAPLNFMRPVYLVDAQRQPHRLALDAHGREIVAGFEAAAMAQRAPPTVRGDAHALFGGAGDAAASATALCCWVIAVRARDPRQVRVDASTRRVSVGLAWSLALHAADASVRDAQQAPAAMPAGAEESDDLRPRHTCTSAASSCHSITLLAGEADLLHCPARTRYLWQTQTTATDALESVPLSGLPPELWHVMRAKHSAGVQKPGMTDAMLLGM